MKIRFGRLLLLALVAALVLALGAYDGGSATTGTFCSPQAPFQSAHPWGIPSSIMFASGPQNVTSATLYLIDEDSVVYALKASNFSRIAKTNHWKADVDFDVPMGSYWSYLYIWNQVGKCGFKYGTIEVVSAFE